MPEAASEMLPRWWKKRRDGAAPPDRLLTREVGGIAPSGGPAARAVAS